MINVSIIIVNYKTKELVENCIRSIVQHTSDIEYEIIIVDNNSNDCSLSYLENTDFKFPAIRYIQLGANIGFAGANNAAVRVADSKYLLFLNPDTLLLNNAVRIFFDFLENSPPDVCAVGTNLKNQHGKPEISFGRFPSLREEVYKLGYNLIYFSKSKYSSAVASENFTGAVDYINGADLFVRTSVFNETGQFDEAFFLYFEETDWCMRATAMGYKNFIIAEPEIIQLGGESIRQSKLKYKLMLFEKSKIYFFWKHFGKSALCWLKFISSKLHLF